MHSRFEDSKVVRLRRLKPGTPLEIESCIGFQEGPPMLQTRIEADIWIKSRAVLRGNSSVLCKAVQEIRQSAPSGGRRLRSLLLMEYTPACRPVAAS